jgi:hypothetical protein
MTQSITASSNPEKSDTAEIPSTRWWESYLVRYFIGFIVGSFCVLLFGVRVGLIDELLKHLAVSNLSNGKPDWSVIALLVALLGIGFCYIASTPITVLHAGRYRRGWLDGHSRHFWFAWVILAFVVFMFGVDVLGNRPILEWGVITVACLALMRLDLIRSEPISKKHPQGAFFLYILIWFVFIFGLVGRLFGVFGHGLDEAAQKWWILSIPTFWILAGQYAVLYRLIHEKEDFFAFYAKLFRARRMKNARDVRDTYTHLREHSNSVFIVVIELAILALFMAVTSDRSITQTHAANIERIGLFLMFGLALWMIPTVFMWARANSIEVEFADKPEIYLG